MGDSCRWMAADSGGRWRTTAPPPPRGGGGGGIVVVPPPPMHSPGGRGQRGEEAQNVPLRQPPTPDEHVPLHGRKVIGVLPEILHRHRLDGVLEGIKYCASVVVVERGRGIVAAFLSAVCNGAVAVRRRRRRHDGGGGEAVLTPTITKKAVCWWWTAVMWMMAVGSGGK